MLTMCITGGVLVFCLNLSLRKQIIRTTYVELVQDIRRERMGTWQVLYDVGSLAIALVGVGIAGWNLHLNIVRTRRERTATKATGKPTVNFAPSCP
jgi:hypothetical protein